MADALDLGSTESAGGLSGLTKKQKDMTYARSPMNNQDINLSSMEQKEGILSAPVAKEKMQEQQGVGGLAQQTRTAATVNNPQIAGLKANLGTFATKLEGAINQYLQGGSVSSVNASLAGGGQPVYDPITKTWKVPDTNITANLTGVLGEKLQQKEQIEQTYAPFRDKKFEDVLNRFADVNGDGVIDAQEQAFLSTSFGIVNALRRLEQLDPYSPEAEALKMQLQMEDREGLVSGLQAAMDRYESVSGMKIAGPEGEDKGLRDLVNMTSDQVLAELQKATEGATGLFSGEAATSLKRGFDEASRQYAGAATEDVEVRNRIKDAADSWLQEYEDSLESSRSAINEQFLGTAQGIIQDLESEKAKLALAGEDTKWIDQAKQWFVDLQSGVASGEKNIAVIIQELLSSEVGMAPEARQALKTWLGQTIGEDTQSQGEIAKLLQEVSNKGYMVTKDENGNTKRVLFTSADKQRIASILGDETLDATEKNDAIRQIIADRSGQLGKDLKKDADYVASLAKDGNFTTALTNFRNSMVTSLKSFKNAAVRDVYNKVIEAGVDPTTLGADGMKGVIEQRSAAMADSINKAADLAKTQIQKIIDDSTKDQKELRGFLTQLPGLRDQGVLAIKQGIERTVNDAVPKYQEAIKNAYIKAGRTPPANEVLADQARTYAYLVYIKSTAGTPFYKALEAKFPQIAEYTSKPSIVFGQTPDDVMRANHVKNNIIPMLPYKEVWETSEASRQINAQEAQIRDRLAIADDMATKSTNLLANIGTAQEKAIADVTGLTNVSPMQMFAAAKTGNTALLNPKFNNYTAEDFAKMGVSLAYSEDPRTQVEANLEYTPAAMQTLSSIEGINQAQLPSVREIPKSPTPIREEKEPMKPKMGGGTDYKVTLRDGRLITVNVPEGRNPEEAIKQVLKETGSAPIDTYSVAPLASAPGYVPMVNTLANVLPKVVAPQPITAQLKAEPPKEKDTGKEKPTRETQGRTGAGQAAEGGSRKTRE